ncbi:MAG TPA: response regulator transcription factor [Longimicrobiales bacterium]|nr:response regulator transcription factor [Longimicrobiales bacterium]
MIRLLVASGVRFYREGLVELLRTDEGIEVVGVAADWDGALAALVELEPSMILLDVNLVPARPALREVVDALCGTKVVVIALPSEERDAVRWVEAGVDGYVASEASIQDLRAVIAAAEKGEARCSPSVAADLFRRISRLSRIVEARRLPPAAAPGELTPRERQVARLLAQGLSNKRIAHRLGIKLTTTKNHVHNVLQKLSLDRRAEVAAWHFGGGDPRQTE